MSEEEGNHDLDHFTRDGAFVQVKQNLTQPEGRKRSIENGRKSSIGKVSLHEKGEGPVEVEEGVIIEDGLRSGLLGRHVSLISLASVIGASCFYGFGYALYLSGPVGALVGFGVVGFVVWALMQSIGEVTTMFPIAGGFIEHAARFVDPAFSFAMAWLYYFM